MCKLPSKTRTVDIPSPRGIIPRDDVYEGEFGEITIAPPVGELWITTVADTNSMDGLLDFGHTCILTDGFRHDELIVGDVVVFCPNLKAPQKTVIHRIHRIWNDGMSRRFTTKGDNNSETDSYTLRDENIKWYLLGIIYTR